MSNKLIQTDLYLLLIDEEVVCKTGELYLTSIQNRIIPKSKGVIQAGDKIIAYRKLIEEAKELDLPLLPNPFEGDVWVKGNRISVTTLYEYEERQDWSNHNKYKNLGYQTYIGEVIEVDKGLALKTDEGKIFKTQGTYWFGSILNQNCKLLEAAQQSDKQFSLEDMKKAFEVGRNFQLTGENNFNELIQSLSSQQIPSEFIPSYKIDCVKVNCNGECGECSYMEKVLKTITNSEGKEVLVGTYKY